MTTRDLEAALREARKYVVAAWGQRGSKATDELIARIDAALSAASGEASGEIECLGCPEICPGCLCPRAVASRRPAPSEALERGSMKSKLDSQGLRGAQMRGDEKVSSILGIRSRPAPSEAPNVERVRESYPIILNGDHAEFEAEWAGKDPKTRPDWPLPSFDARDWAEAFCKTADKLGHPNIDVEWMTGWFANALMRGYDHQAPRIAELEKERDSARAEGIAAERDRLRQALVSAYYQGGRTESEAQRCADAAIRAGAKP